MIFLKFYTLVDCTHYKQSLEQLLNAPFDRPAKDWCPRFCCIGTCEGFSVNCHAAGRRTRLRTMWQLLFLDTFQLLNM